mmetsp:Transcript_1896/g.4428  ORF Transcript_1896/g.4428 Transcript_1896/m.4428 type:complete len:216 (-) Transcript_1896:1776-2423(-)
MSKMQAPQPSMDLIFNTCWINRPEFLLVLGRTGESPCFTTFWEGENRASPLSTPQPGSPTTGTENATATRTTSLLPRLQWLLFPVPMTICWFLSTTCTTTGTESITTQKWNRPVVLATKLLPEKIFSQAIRSTTLTTFVIPAVDERTDTELQKSSEITDLLKSSPSDGISRNKNSCTICTKKKRVKSTSHGGQKSLPRRRISRSRKSFSCWNSDA